MKLVIYKFFADYEKEEAWLNEMAADGLAFTGMFFRFYRFEFCPPGEYIYRMECLENRPEHPESRKYIRFMLENNAEPVAFWDRWVYFRRKAEYGSFGLYTDIDSRLAHYRRLYAVLKPVMILEFLVSIPWIAVFLLKWLNEPPVFDERYFSLGCFFLGFGFVLFLLGRPLRKKMRALKQEKLLRE